MNKNKIQKAIISLEKQKRIHEEKIKSEIKNFGLLNYWEKEIKVFDNEIKRLKEKFKK